MPFTSSSSPPDSSVLKNGSVHLKWLSGDSKLYMIMPVVCLQLCFEGFVKPGNYTPLNIYINMFSSGTF